MKKKRIHIYIQNINQIAIINSVGNKFLVI